LQYNHNVTVILYYIILTYNLPFGLIQHSIQWPPCCTGYWTGELVPFSVNTALTSVC